MPAKFLRIAVAALSLAVFCAPMDEARSAQPAVASDISLEGSREQARVSVTLDRPVEARVFTLANPYRVVIDLPETVFAGQEPGEGAGMVSAYRFGMIAPGRGRLVLDTRGPVAVTTESRAGEDRRSARLVVSLKQTGRDAFNRQMALQAPAATEAPVRAAPRAEQDERPLIVLDPGHGGVDPGARSRTGEQEKHIVLEFAKSLRDTLEKTGRYRVLMTRDDDTFLSLGARVRVARENEAQLFISIHADSLSASAGVRGATVYSLGDRPTDAEAAQLAEKENRADAAAGIEDIQDPDEVAGILFELAQRETKVFTARFSQILYEGVRGSIRMNKNPQRSAGFRVLRAPDVPSVLLELGYMSSREDLKSLTSEAWRARAGNAMVGAIDRFFGADVTRKTARGTN